MCECVCVCVWGGNTWPSGAVSGTHTHTQILRQLKQKALWGQNSVQIPPMSLLKRLCCSRLSSGETGSFFLTWEFSYALKKLIVIQKYVSAIIMFGLELRLIGQFKRSDHAPSDSFYQLETRPWPVDLRPASLSPVHSRWLGNRQWISGKPVPPPPTPLRP